MDNYITQMNEIIDNSPYGSSFVVSDFTDIMNYETAKKTISRLEKKGLIRRVMRGVYDKPQYSSVLNEYSAPDPASVAQALARNYNWTIAPSGEAALNMLGLSTQVPANWVYISSGPYREYFFGSVTLRFIHRSNRSISGMSWKTAMVIEALKEIGKDQINDSIIRHLRQRLTEEDKETLMREGRQANSWVYEAIKKICTEERNR